MAEKKITRTFSTYSVVIRDSVTGNELKKEVSEEKPTKEKVAIKYIKETGNTGFFVEINEVNEKREMSVDDFIKYSIIVPETAEVTPVESPKQETETPAKA